MQLKFISLAGALLAAGLSGASAAQSEPGQPPLGADKPVLNFFQIRVKNFQDDSLGRIKELGIDLVNGRIVEVLIVADDSLGLGDKIVAVPPLALTPDSKSGIYRLNARTELFKVAPAVDLSKWVDSGRSNRIAAAYRLFGQEPYFLEEGDTAAWTDARPKVPLGYVERSGKILGLSVGNFQNVPFGVVSSMALDIPNGRIRHVIVQAPGNLKLASVIPAMALSFNPARDALLLDDTKPEYADEPRYVLTEAAYGQKAYSQEANYQGPHTSVDLEQGSAYRDIDRTVRIHHDIRASNIRCRHLEVGTINGRVTLRGWVETDGERRQLGDIAIADCRVELVDNQIKSGNRRNAAN